MARKTTRRATPSGARKKAATAGNEERPLRTTGLADYGYWWQVLHRASKVSHSGRRGRIWA